MSEETRYKHTPGRTPSQADERERLPSSEHVVLLALLDRMARQLDRVEAAATRAADHALEVGQELAHVRRKFELHISKHKARGEMVSTPDDSGSMDLAALGARVRLSGKVPVLVGAFVLAVVGLIVGTEVAVHAVTHGHEAREHEGGKP